ncbi:MAG TPA: hypothetical protein PLR90_05435 [Methylophilus sp.]|nr:hypothetical protein [Methylophilus sp.]
MANSLAMTALLICLGLAGHSSLAADVGIVQGVTLALFYSFSANARNLILNQVTPIQPQSLLIYRFVLLLPLAAIAFLLARLSEVDPWLAAILLARRSIEWLDEIFLSEMERMERKAEAVRYILLQAFSLAFALGWMLAGMPFPLFGIFLWAVLPLWLSGGYYARLENFRIRVPTDTLRRISPHIGSTAIIGITVYVFRLLLVDMAGKEIAGNLFVAFAIGGVLGSIVANAFGPSMVLAQGRLNTRVLPSSLKVLMAAFLAIGLLITLSSTSLHLLAKSSLFWLAVGFSMIGAAPMVLAQIIRHRLLQHHEDQDLFGSDVLMNVLLVTMTPFVFYLFGLQGMAGLYLLSSLLAWVFYKSCESHENGSLACLEAKYPLAKPILAGMMIFPIFFQLGSGIFRDAAILFNANREILKLPIPFSVLASFAILIGIGNFARARMEFVFIFLTFVLMLLAVIVSTPPDTIQQQAKFFLLAQFVLPIFALIAGQIFESEQDAKVHTLEKSIFYVLVLIVPLQIISSWLQGSWILMPSVYAFSVYQYLHYVPIMFVAAYMFVFYRLWHYLSKTALMLLTLLMSIYVVMTASLFVSIAYFFGLLIYAVCLSYYCEAKNIKLYFILACIVGIFYWQISGVENGLIVSQSPAASVGIIEKAGIALQQKSTIWSYYSDAVLSDFKTFVFGHQGILSRSQYSSAHNYYLDLVYNFGLLGALPLLMLLGYTLYMMYVNSKVITERSALFFPCLVLLFLLLVENFFYVGLRQPYPGILTFFIWGIVLNRLVTINLAREAG